MGFDGLPYTIIKNFSPLTIIFLASLFNHMIGICYFPTQWKNALVLAIPKPGKNSKIITNWRPISQLSCLSKIFEKIIYNRISIITNNMKIFNNQFGFLPHHSTEHALCKIQNSINNGLNRGKITVISKMMALGINPFICKIIKSFLDDRGFAVSLGGFITGLFKMISGIPQGSVLSPMIFNIFTNDIPINNHIKITQFADDITLHYTHKKPGVAQNLFNTYLATLAKYFDKIGN